MDIFEQHSRFCPRCQQEGKIGQKVCGIKRFYQDERGRETFVCYVGQCPICGHMQRFGDKFSIYTTKDGVHFNFNYKKWYIFKELGIDPDKFIDAIFRNQFTKYINWREVKNV